MIKKTDGPTPEYISEKRDWLGKMLRQLREERGYSQDELAEIMQVHRSTISKVETGKFSITADYLFKFSWHLDFEITLLAKRPL